MELRGSDTGIGYLFYLTLGETEILEEEKKLENDTH